MKNLDIPTVVVVTALSGLVSSLVILFATRSFAGHVRTLRLWASGSLLKALGWIAFIVFARSTDWIRIGVANSLLMFGSALLVLAMHEFRTGNRRLRFVFVLAVLEPIAMVYFKAVHDSPIMRAHANGVFTVGIIIAGLYELISCKMETGSPLRWLCVCFGGASAMLLVLRSMLMYTTPRLVLPFFHPSWMQSLFYGSFFVSGEIFTFMFVLLCNERFSRGLKLEAALDPLTRIFHRGSITSMAETEIGRSRRTTTPFSALLLDLDHFKSINDTYGHGVGDAALLSVVSTLQSKLREGDAIGRYGGEEMLILLPNTAEGEAYDLAERLRIAVETTPVVAPDASIALTTSIGVAELGLTDDIDDLLRRADKALYAAKALGRNRTATASDGVVIVAS